MFVSSFLLLLHFATPMHGLDTIPEKVGWRFSTPQTIVLRKDPSIGQEMGPPIIIN